MKIIIATTVPTTVRYILSGQPKYLSKYFDVTLVSSGGEKLTEIAKAESVSSHEVNFRRKISPLHDIFAIFQMIIVILKVKPDIVHSYTPKAGLVSMIAAFICRVPVRVHTFTGLLFPTSSGIKRRILCYVDRLICFCATKIVPEGNGVKKDLIENNVTRKVLNVIGHGNIAGVDTSYFKKSAVIKEVEVLKAKLKIPKQGFVFCFVGRFAHDKGFNELIEAFCNLPKEAHLLLVGTQDERTPLEGRVLDIILSHPRIYRTGWVEDVRPPMSFSDVLVLPSYREGFPNTPLQAGSLELPSIVTDINGCNEIIEDGVNGWIVAARSSDELAFAMFEAMHSPNLKNLGTEARNRIKLKFERAVYREKLKEFYLGLTKNYD